MEREGVLIDAPLLEAMSRELGAKMLELEAHAHREAGQPFNLNSPKQIGEIFFESKGMPVVKKTPSGAPSDRRGRAGKTRARPPFGENAARLPRDLEAQVDLHRQAAAHGECAHRPRAHDLRPGDRGHRAPRFERSEPAEHSGENARGAAHPRGLHRAQGPRDRQRRLFADRAAHHGAHLRRREPAASLRRQARTCTAPPPRRCSAGRSRK